MYNYFEGRLDELTPAYAVIDCNGVGYMLEISLSTYESIKAHTINSGEKLRLFVHEVIREDAHQLYGFYEQDERNMFRLLISVNGVGPSSARVILSSMNTIELQQAIANQDSKSLQRAKGIGAKTAQRIVLELQDKTNILGAIPLSSENGLLNQNLTEATSALVMLGFAKPNIDKAFKSIDTTPNLSVEELIKLALKKL